MIPCVENGLVIFTHSFCSQYTKNHTSCSQGGGGTQGFPGRRRLPVCCTLLYRFVMTSGNPLGWSPLPFYTGTGSDVW